MTLHVAIAAVCSRSGGRAQVADVAAAINAHGLYVGVRTGGKGDLCNQARADTSVIIAHRCLTLLLLAL